MNLSSNVEIVLASASPRRQELIGTLGLPFRVTPSHYIEPSPPEHPVSLPDFVTLLATEKAMEVAKRLQTTPFPSDNIRYILGADTLVSLEETIGTPLGKPKDTQDAFRMLSLLSGRTHFVYTGIALIGLSKDHNLAQPVTRVVKTKVRFRELSDSMISRYIETGEPMDKAGAYGAQGYAAPFIEGFEGDFFNVVGLPLCELGKLLEDCGVCWADTGRKSSFS